MTNDHSATVTDLYCVGQTAFLGLGLQFAFHPAMASFGVAGLVVALGFVAAWSWVMREAVL